MTAPGFTATTMSATVTVAAPIFAGKAIAGELQIAFSGCTDVVAWTWPVPPSLPAVNWPCAVTVPSVGGSAVHERGVVSG